MTKQHFEIIAEHLGRSYRWDEGWTPEAYELVLKVLCKAFTNCNPRFNADMFLDAVDAWARAQKGPMP